MSHSIEIRDGVLELSVWGYGVIDLPTAHVDAFNWGWMWRLLRGEARR